jgi:hypothetical protein
MQASTRPPSGFDRLTMRALWHLGRLFRCKFFRDALAGDEGGQV